MAYNVAYPDSEYHEILPKLFLGGHVWQENGRIRDGRNSSVSADKTLDYVVSAYIDIFNETYPRCDTRLVIFDDTENGLTEDTWEQISSAVEEVVARWKQGQKILVRCQAGYNRSGLLMSLILMRLGYTADGAIELIRKLRGKDVLVNKAFENYVHEREDEYRFPTQFAVDVANLVVADGD